jgi:hypothetical protein
MAQQCKKKQHTVARGRCSNTTVSVSHGTVCHERQAECVCGATGKSTLAVYCLSWQHTNILGSACLSRHNRCGTESSVLPPTAAERHTVVVSWKQLCRPSRHWQQQQCVLCSCMCHAVQLSVVFLACLSKCVVYGRVAPSAVAGWL